MKLKSHFIYNKTERKEIIIFLTIVCVGLIAYNLIDFESEGIIDMSSPEVLALIDDMETQKLAMEETRKKKIYPFNPNYLTDFRAYMLGMSTDEIDRLLKYRNEGKWINSVNDFQAVTMVSDSLLNTFKEHFKFPEWVANPKETRNHQVKKDFPEKERPIEKKIDLNVATVEDLQKISGIGPVLSERIVAYRNQLGGFSDDTQLYDVYGLDPAVVQRTLTVFTVKTPKKIEKLNINKSSASDLATIPGVSYDLGKKLWEYRKLRGTVDSIEEILKVKGMTEQKFKQIRLYLSVE